MDRDTAGREVIALLLGIFVAMLFVILLLKSIDRKLTPPEREPVERMVNLSDVFWS